MLIHFIRNGTSYLPEIDAYCEYIHARGHHSMVHDNSHTVPSNAAVVWWFCGGVPIREAHRLREAFQIHEYASASVPPYAWLKDHIKHWTQPRPDYRIYQNGWVRERLGFADTVPHALRDMGVAEHFFDSPLVKPTSEFDLVYSGEMSRLLAFIPLLYAIETAGRSLLLVGEVPEALQIQLPSKVTCTGRVEHLQVPRYLRSARFGLNLMPKTIPFLQQTSTKVLEYCAVGLPVVSNAYPWIRYFMAQNKGNFYLLNDDPSSLATSFGEALEAYPYVVPDIRTLAWPQVLDTLTLWRTVLR
ncbi:MAG: glycosyltransferase [Betaproteobacteria bacterium]|jgi:glycosyltransferase involved in cell wall biosynthesis